MRTTLMLLAIFLFSSLSLSARQSPAHSEAGNKSPAQTLPADAPSREQLFKLFEVLEIRKQVDSMRETMGKALEQQFAQMGRGQVSAKQADEFAKLEGELFGKLMSDDFVMKMTEELVPIYQRHFKSSDVEALTAFYSTTVGQKFLHEQAQIMAEYMPKAMESMQGRVQKAMEETHFTERVEQIMGQSENKAPAKP